MKKLLTTCAIAAGLLALGLSSDALAAPKYADVKVPPTIRVIVSYNAGGSSDTLARITLPYWEKAIQELTGKKVNAVVVNLPGAGGEIGWTSLAHTQADGSTIGIINLPAVPLVEAARDAGFEPWLENFTALGVNVIDPNVIRLAKDSGFATLKEAFAAAKSKPGSVTVGADGPLSDDHLAMYAAAQKLGAEFAFVPYKGGAPANRAVQAGEVDIGVGNVFDLIKTKDSVKDACVLRPTRYDMIADVGTCEEVLGVAIGDLGSTRGFAIRTGAPEDLITVYREAFGMAFADQQYLADAKKRNITVVEPRVGEAFSAVMKDQQELVGVLLEFFVKGGYIKN